MVHFLLLLLPGWDQSDKFVKIYITLTGVHQVPAENVQVHFTERWVLIMGKTVPYYGFFSFQFLKFCLNLKLSFISALKVESYHLGWPGAHPKVRLALFPQRLKSTFHRTRKIKCSLLCCRSFDLLVKNLNGKSYSMIVNNLLKPISVEGSSKKVGLLFLS